jgi:hypothetical protein
MIPGVMDTGFLCAWKPTSYMTTLNFFSSLATPAGIFPMRKALSLGDTTDDVFHMSNDQLTAAADHLRTLAGLLDGLRTRHHILYHGEGNWSMFSGTDAELAQELLSCNKINYHGETVVECSFDTEQECREDLELQRSFHRDTHRIPTKTSIIRKAQEQGLEVETAPPMKTYTISDLKGFGISHDTPHS